MKKIQLLAMTLLTALLGATTLFAEQEQQLPEVTEDGLHRVPDSRMAIVYAEPNADLSAYQKVMLLDAYVAFKKNWERDQRSRSASRLTVTSRDVENIKNNLAEEFKIVFESKLEGGGFPVVGEAADDVLLIRPAIINLDVNAPDTPNAGRSQSYTSSAGEMTLYIELYDSVTGDLIAKALDRRVDDSRSGYYTWTNSVTNKAAADRIIGGWADILLDALKEARNPAKNDS
jgi:hypothetical protein